MRYRDSNYTIVGSANPVTQSTDLNDQILRSIDHVDASYKIRFTTLLRTYETVFSKSKSDTGEIKLESARVNLSDDNPIYLRPYWCSQKEQEIINGQVQSLLENNFIKRSFSPIAFPVTLVSKKDEGEKSRFCVDFRKLDKVTISDNFPFPRIENIIDRIHGAKVFSAFDISSGFWHIPVDPSDTHKLAFATTDDHFEWP